MCSECNGVYPNCPVCGENGPDQELIKCDCNGEKNSDCCGVPIDPDTLICTQCHEHAEIYICEYCQGTGEYYKY